MLPRKPEEIMPKEMWDNVKNYLSFKEDRLLTGVCKFFQKPREDMFSIEPIYQDFFEKNLLELGIIDVKKITRPIAREFCLLLKEHMLAHLNNKPFDSIEYITAHPTLKKSLDKILIPLSPNIDLDDIKFRRDNPKYEYSEYFGTSVATNAPLRNQLNELHIKELRSAEIEPNNFAVAALLDSIFLGYTGSEVIFSLKNIINLTKQLPKKEREPLLNALMALNDIEIDPAVLKNLLFNAAARCLNILIGANIKVKDIVVKTSLKDILIDNLKEIVPPYLPQITIRDKDGSHVRFTFNSSEKAKESQEKLEKVGFKTKRGTRQGEHLVDLNPIEPAAIHLAFLKSTNKINYKTTSRKKMRLGA